MTWRLSPHIAAHADAGSNYWHVCKAKSRPTSGSAATSGSIRRNLVHAITVIGGHHQHQVIQKSTDHVIVQIVPNCDWTPDHHQRLIWTVHDFFEAPIQVQLELKERLELRSEAKLQSMVCEV